MFACIVAGRAPVAAQQVAPDRFVFALEDISSVNHLVVFCTNPFPEGFGATCHFNLGQGGDWLQLGALSNQKPSAIFRLQGASKSTGSGFQLSQGPATATLGILCQDLNSIESHLLSNSQLVPRARTLASTSDAIQLASQIAKNLFNYLSSFAQAAPGSVVGSYVDISLLEKWFKTFEAKTKASGNTQWLENSE